MWHCEPGCPWYQFPNWWNWEKKLTHKSCSSITKQSHFWSWHVQQAFKYSSVLVSTDEPGCLSWFLTQYSKDHQQSQMTQIRTDKKSSTSAYGGVACTGPVTIMNSGQYIKHHQLYTLESNKKQADAGGKKTLRREALLLSELPILFWAGAR